MRIYFCTHNSYTSTLIFITSYELLGWVLVFSAGFHTSVGVMMAVLGGMVV